ncbi:TPA: VTC domain-containing protein, partial [Streptococcus suis]|nr:VTC domain-containing protein [Streptococcus suis]
IMEVKVPEERPDWLVALLEKYQIEKQSFSKYGNAYKLAHNITGEEVSQHAVV